MTFLRKILPVNISSTNSYYWNCAKFLQTTAWPLISKMYCNVFFLNCRKKKKQVYIQRSREITCFFKLPLVISLEISSKKIRQDTLSLCIWNRLLKIAETWVSLQIYMHVYMLSLRIRIFTLEKTLNTQLYN